MTQQTTNAERRPFLSAPSPKRYFAAAAIEEARTLLSLDQGTPINLVRANHADSLPQLLKSMLGAAMADVRTLLELALPALRIVA